MTDQRYQYKFGKVVYCDPRTESGYNPEWKTAPINVVTFRFKWYIRWYWVVKNWWYGGIWRKQ